MNETVAHFIRTRHIDSFQKLRSLLFLFQRPDLTGSSQELAQQLCLGNVPLVESIIVDLQRAGLLDCVEGRFELRNDPDILSCLQRLARTIEDPLDRQVILDRVTYGQDFGGYLEEAYELH